MNNNEKVYYVYTENGKAILTDEKPDFDKTKNYTMVKGNKLECIVGGKKSQDELSLPDEPIDVAAKLIQATVTAKVPKYGVLYPVLETEGVEIPKYDIIQLQEIAEHLLAYCKAQERGCGEQISFTSQSITDAISVLRRELLQHGEIYNGFKASLKSALEHYNCCGLPFEPEDDVARKILDFMIGE